MSDLVRGLISSYRGVIQGIYYGTKVRLPHALVMTFIFHEGTLQSKIRSIASLTFQHARNLASFVGIYKGLITLFRQGDSSVGVVARPIGTALHPWHSLVAGAVGGYLVWGHETSVNVQIVLYLLSRVLLALFKLYGPHFSNASFSQVFPYLAAATWGLVLWLYEFHGPLLQPSLYQSMKTLYADSCHWSHGVKDFVPSPAAAAVIAYVVTTTYWVDKKPLKDLLDISKKVLG